MIARNGVAEPSIPALLALLLVVTGVSVFAGSICYDLGRSEIQQQAIKAGVAVYEADPQTGVVTFRFIQGEGRE